MDLSVTCRHFLTGTTVDNGNFFCVHTGCTAACIHGNVTAADDGYAVSLRKKSAVLRQVSLADVHSCQVIVGCVYTLQILSGDVHGGGNLSAGTDEYGLEALFLHQILNGDVFTNHRACYELYALGFQFADDLSYDILRKTEFRDSVYQDTACYVQALIYCHIYALVSKVRCAGQACRAGADHGCLMPVGFCLCNLVFAMCGMPVTYETLDASDCHRLSFDAMYTAAFALILVRADTAADRCQCADRADDLVCCFKITLSNLGDEFRNAHLCGAALHHARFFPAFQAAHSLTDGHILCVTLGNLFEVAYTNLGRLLRHRIFFSD